MQWKRQFRYTTQIQQTKVILFVQNIHWKATNIAAGSASAKWTPSTGRNFQNGWFTLHTPVHATTNTTTRKYSSRNRNQSSISFLSGKIRLSYEL